MRFGEKLRALRREKGLTQAELAKLAGVGLKTITNYEKGSTYPQNREVYGILAGILGCDADYLHNEGDDFIAMAGQEYGLVFQIDRILYKCRASSKKVGGGGIRYTVQIRGRESYLFQEGSKWFVEAKET